MRRAMALDGKVPAPVKPRGGKRRTGPPRRRRSDVWTKPAGVTRVEIRTIGGGGGGGSGHSSGGLVSSSGGSVTTGASAGGGVGGSTFQLLQPGEAVSMGAHTGGATSRAAVEDALARLRDRAQARQAPDPHPMCQCQACVEHDPL